MKREILEGNIDIVIAKDLSRIGRHNAKTLLFIEELEQMGITVIAINDDLDTSKEQNHDLVGIKTWYNELYVKEDNKTGIETQGDAIDVAIELCLYCMKTQIFNDGNKRASVIFANHYLISKAGGLLVIPENHVSEFKKLLIGYYENKDNGEIKAFLKQNCHRNFR